MKLWQASMSTPIRMRVGPTSAQVLRDSLDFSEACRVNDLAGADDLFIWMSKVCSMDTVQKILAGPVHPPRSLFVNTIDALKLTWKGQKLSCAQSMWVCSQYLFHREIKAAWLALVGCAPTFNTLDKLYRVFQCSEAWTGEKGEDVCPLLAWVMQFCHNMILFREVLEKDCTGFGLFGRGKNPGLLHGLLVKHDLRNALMDIYTENRTKAGLGGGAFSEVWQKLGPPLALKQNFAPPGYSPKLADDWEEAEDEPNFKNGIAHYCEPQFQEWQKTLTEPMDSTLADILFGLHGKRFNEVVQELAMTHTQGQTVGEWQRAISAALRGGTSDNPKTDLQTAFDAFQEAYQNKPILAQAGRYKDNLLLGETGQVGPAEVDPNKSHALGGDNLDEAAQLEQQEKREIAEKLSKWRHQQVIFHCSENGAETNFADHGVLNKMLMKTFFQKERMVPNTKRIWLIPLDLFPPMVQAWAAERKDKDYLARHQDLAKLAPPEALKKLLSWILQTRMPDRDWVVLCDGRFKQAHKIWDESCDQAHLDHGFLEELFLGYTDYADGDFRAPQRKLAWQSNKGEKIFLAMPNVKRSALAASPRSDFNLCGEESSFDTQYTGVEMRSLAEIPMLTPEDLATLGLAPPDIVFLLSIIPTKTQRGPRLTKQHPGARTRSWTTEEV